MTITKGLKTFFGLCLAGVYQTHPAQKRMDFQSEKSR